MLMRAGRGVRGAEGRGGGGATVIETKVENGGAVERKRGGGGGQTWRARKRDGGGTKFERLRRRVGEQKEKRARFTVILIKGGSAKAHDAQHTGTLTAAKA
jgi:hypothetical protein